LTWVGGVQGHKTLAGFALAWSLTVLLPTLVMPLNMLVNERRLYLVVAAFAWFGASLYTSRYRTGFGIMVLILGALTVGRNRVWSDEVSLWLDAKDKAPLMYRVHANLGKALQLNGRNEAALAAYTKAIELEPGNGEAYNNIATLYHLRGELAEAIHWYGQALERYPRHAGMRQNLADAYYGMGVFDQVIDWYQQALEMDPGDGQIWNNYGQTLYAAGQYKTAETAFLKALDIIPEQPEIYNNLGNIYSRYSDYPRSIEMYKKALDCEPEDVASVWANLADAYRQAGLTVQARQAITSAMQTAPKSPHLMLLAGRIERQGGDFSKAFGWLTEALSHDAANVRLWVEMAEIEVERGNGEAALTHFVQATKIDLTYSRAWYGLARLKETQKDSAGALEAYRRFSETWTADDMRALEVRRKIKALEAGG
jgi:tetratricopeptide (TPR) repeat protein